MAEGSESLGELNRVNSADMKRSQTERVPEGVVTDLSATNLLCRHNTLPTICQTPHSI